MSEKSKITVKHYLNTRAKPKIFEGETFYPVYLQIIAAGQKAQLKSKVSDHLNIYKISIEKKFTSPGLSSLIQQGYFSDSKFSQVNTERIFPLYFLLKDEISIVTYIIKNLLTGSGKLCLANFSSIYDLYIKDINIILDEYIKRYYLTDLNKILQNAHKREDSKKLFNISDFFIHYIDWQAPFCSYYKKTSEVLPTEIKLLENYLEENLKKDINALLAFHSCDNHLRKYLDKTEKGRFPHPNYIDWIEQGKDLVAGDFIRIFGRHKASEYIASLDEILSREIEADTV